MDEKVGRFCASAIVDEEDEEDRDAADPVESGEMSVLAGRVGREGVIGGFAAKFQQVDCVLFVHIPPRVRLDRCFQDGTPGRWEPALTL